MTLDFPLVPIGIETDLYLGSYGGHGTVSTTNGYPIPAGGGELLLPLLLAKINCAGCDAPCCRYPAPDR